MIVRRIQDVEVIDVGKPNGLPEGAFVIQWIVSNEVGDKRYRHRFAVRKYTLQPLKVEIPFHNHKYIQAMIITKGRVRVECPEEAVEIGPGDTAYFYENEPHRAYVIGDEPVEFYCIIDCPESGDNCWPKEIPKVTDCFTK